MFTQTCVGIVLSFFICMATFLIGKVVGWIGDEDFGIFFSWFISSIGFGVCLTMILYQNGIIR